MPDIIVRLTLSQYLHHDDLIRDLTPIYQASMEDTVLFSIDLNTGFIYGDFLLLIINAIKYIEQKGIFFKVSFENFDPTLSVMQYVSRIDFFKYAQFDFAENFNRQDSDGRFTEIVLFNDYQGANIVHNRIIRILNAGTLINESTLRMFQYSLWEVIDNVLNHANSLTGGSCIMQLFPNVRELRVMVCDKGIGIHKALTTLEKSHFKNLSEEEAIIECIKKGVTNGDGMGNGLYHTSEFIKHNKGIFILHSGNYVYKITNGAHKIYHTSHWKGVYLFMKINTTIDVDDKLILGDNSTLKDDFDFLFGD